MSPFDAVLWVVASTAFLFLIAIPWLNGLLDIVIAYRFQKSAIHRGAPLDVSAFILNWIAFKWLWLHNAYSIVARLPFLQHDLSKTFGVNRW